MRKLIAANWKMNPAPLELRRDKPTPYHPHPNVDVVVFPTFLDLKACIAASIVTGGQCGRPESSGAFTGDISMQMLKDCGATYVLCGHSDRRQFHGESDAFVAGQAEAALKIGLIPIVCIGETAEERATGKSCAVIERQVRALVPNLQSPISNLLALAYEPIWAISRGDPNKPAATANDAQEMHAFIRSLLPNEMKTTRILYGGSMKGENAQELLSLPDIDGGLVGGASLKPEEFRKIVTVAASID